MRAFTKVMLTALTTASVVQIVANSRNPNLPDRHGSVLRTLFPWVTLGIVVQDMADAVHHPANWT